MDLDKLLADDTDETTSPEVVEKETKPVKKRKGKNSPVIGDNGLETLPGERWKPIEGYEGYYEISSRGRVKSLERFCCNPAVLGSGNYRKVHERIRTPNVMKGYYCTALIKDGNKKVFRIHRMVAEHFIGKCPSDVHQVNHINGDKSDNRVENLEWVTPAENTAHAFEHGLRPKQPTDETRHKMAIATTKRWEDEKYRDFQSNMMKQTWERRKKQGWTSWKETK